MRKMHEIFLKQRTEAKRSEARSNISMLLLKIRCFQMLLLSNALFSFVFESDIYDSQ